MDDRFEQLCLGHLPQLGLKPACKGQEVKNGVGFTFVPDPEIGEGYLWTYPINSTCSLTIYDIVFHENVSFRYYHPAALTIAVSSPGSAEPVFTNVGCHSENLVGYFLDGMSDVSVSVKSTTDNTVYHFKDTLNLTTKVRMTRSIDDIDLCTFIGNGCVF